MHQTTNTRDQVYAAALQLIQAIDDSLRRGTRHFRTVGGRRLEHLDQVVHAIIDGTLDPEA